MVIRGRKLDLSEKTYVMGILNVTPDSFSDGGLHNSTDEAVVHALRMINEGAAIIDIGGESTRPGFTPVEEEEEIGRILPVIRALRNESDIPISVDTTKASVARAAMNEGADIINSVAGIAAGPDMMSAVRDTGAFFVMTYEDSYVNQFGEALIAMAENAVSAGIAEDKIILDPGIGFGKTQEDNLRILNELPIITQVGYPVLLGCSRKSVIGHALGQPDEERLSGTIVTTVLASLAGVGIVRVHDVAENVRALKMLGAVCSAECAAAIGKKEEQDSGR
ncbi:MAG: dihydropteroate synthase [Lachnospiraceae bacterium]|nr:dihydropteroate synthase [Lachnospiraceae bacterium]